MAISEFRYNKKAEALCLYLQTIKIETKEQFDFVQANDDQNKGKREARHRSKRSSLPTSKPKKGRHFLPYSGNLQR